MRDNHDNIAIIISNDFQICFQITWFTDDNVVIDEGVRTRTEVMKDGKRHVTISTLKFAAMTEHHNKNFTCQAQNSAIRQPQSVSTR